MAFTVPLLVSLLFDDRLVAVCAFASGHRDQPRGHAWATAVLDRPVLLVMSIGLLATPLTIGARSFGYEAQIPESLGDVAVVPVLYYLALVRAGRSYVCPSADH